MQYAVTERLVIHVEALIQVALFPGHHVEVQNKSGERQQGQSVAWVVLERKYGLTD